MDNNLKELAYKIADLLTEYNLDSDVAIYFNELRLQCFTTNNTKGWVLEEGFKGSEYTEYANDKTITMTFEGPLYDVLNSYMPLNHFHEKFYNILKKYDYYYELGNAWNLALYKL
jgi:hypothetical protein